MASATILRMRNYAGQRIGMLLVIGEVGRSRNGQILWGCNCDCGNTAIVLGNSLRLGTRSNGIARPPTRSCGCLRRHNVGAEMKPESALRRLWHVYRAHAQRRDLEWTLTFDQFRMLTSSPCFYTGRLPSQRLESFNAKDEYIYNGIDSTKGYTLENCVPCYGPINWMKRDLSFSDFVRLCGEVSALHGGAHGRPA